MEVQTDVVMEVQTVRMTVARWWGGLEVQTGAVMNSVHEFSFNSSSAADSFVLVDTATLPKDFPPPYLHHRICLAVPNVARDLHHGVVPVAVKICVMV